MRRQPQALPLALLEWAAGCGALAGAITLGAGLASGGLFAIWGATALVAAIVTSQVHAPSQGSPLDAPIRAPSRVPSHNAVLSVMPSQHNIQTNNKRTTR